MGLSIISNDIFKLKKLFINKSNIYYSIHGDFNAKHHLWTNLTNQRGNEIVDWITNNNFYIKNDGSYTHISPNGKESAIDLTLVSHNFKFNIIDWQIDK
jgi:hypothetical protein